MLCGALAFYLTLTITACCSQLTDKELGHGEVKYGAKVREITSMRGVSAENLLISGLEAEFHNGQRWLRLMVLPPLLWSDGVWLCISVEA